MAEPHGGHFANDHHALAAGQVAGVLAGRFPGAELVDDAEGNHKPEVRVIIWGEAYRVRVEPEPAEEP